MLQQFLIILWADQTLQHPLNRFENVQRLFSRTAFTLVCHRLRITEKHNFRVIMNDNENVNGYWCVIRYLYKILCSCNTISFCTGGTAPDRARLFSSHLMSSPVVRPSQPRVNSDCVYLII